MKTFITISFLFLLPLNLAAKDLSLSLGESRNLPLPSGKGSVWVQDGYVVKAESSGGHLQIHGRHEGMTTVKVGNDIFKVQVLHPEKKETFQSLHENLQKIVGLTAEITDGDLVVSGRLYRFNDWLRLANMMRETSFTFQMRADMSDGVRELAQRHFNRIFEKAKIPPQTLVFQPSAEIRVVGPDITIKKYQQIFRPFGVKVVKDEQSLDIAPTVKIQITVAEVRRSFIMKYGLQWPGNFSGQIMADGTVTGEADFNVNALESRGLGKVLASPNIICKSGKDAEFLAGGEFPIKILNYRIQDIIWKRYGILLKVKPIADSSGRMSISIETEVSTVDDSRKVDDVPGILTNRVSSHFDLTRPQTIALSGLLKAEDSRGSQGLPILSRLPILGPLFSSKDFLENRTELVIFVRPSILKEGEDGSGTEHLGDMEEGL